MEKECCRDKTVTGAHVRRDGSREATCHVYEAACEEEGNGRAEVKAEEEVKAFYCP